jgi:hypothetical protein
VTDSAPSELPPAPNGPIQVFVREPAQLFSSIDRSPFVERDLDEEAERFILTWARDLAEGEELALDVHLACVERMPGEAAHIADAIRLHFRRRADMASRELRALLRRGRISLVIGLVFVTLTTLAAGFIVDWLGTSRLSMILQTGLTVVGWVSLWRPMEIFLYDWWPLAGDRRLFRRLAEMPVRVGCNPAD